MEVLDVDQMAEMVLSLSTRLQISDSELATALNKEAIAEVLDYTGQMTLVGNMDIYVKKLAVINYNRLGVEGETQRTEGGVTNYLEVGIPKDIRLGLNHYRIAKVTRL